MAAAGIRMKKNTNLLICTCEKEKRRCCSRGWRGPVKTRHIVHIILYDGREGYPEQQ